MNCKKTNRHLIGKGDSEMILDAPQTKLTQVELTEFIDMIKRAKTLRECKRNLNKEKIMPKKAVIGDKIKYTIGDEEKIGKVVDVFFNGDIRTNTDGIRLYGEYTII